MNRRTLFGTLTAGLAGLLVPAAAQADSMEASPFLPGFQYNHFGQVLDEMIEFARHHPDPTFLPCDDRDLKTIGFAGFYLVGTVEHSKTWEIHLKEVRRLVPAMPKGLQKGLVSKNIVRNRQALVAFVKAEARRERVSVLPVRQLKEYSAELTVDVSEEGAIWKLHLWKGAEQFYFTVVRNRRGLVKAVIPEFYEQLGVWCGQTSETLASKSTDVETFGNQFRDFRYHSPRTGST